ncbi:UNVERIFIED_CONTAM: hypothetical protein FKN15_019970 [Acipenser sinensis]
MPRPPSTRPCAQVAGWSGTVACMVPYSTSPWNPDVAAQEEDVAAQEEDVTAQKADVACAPPAGCSVPPTYCSTPTEIQDVAAPVHSHAPLPASPCYQSPACATVAQGKPSGSLLAGAWSLPECAGGRTDPPSSPPVEEGED